VNPHTFSRAIALLRSGKVRVGDLPIDRFPLEGVHDALRHHREGLTFKCIIIP
jgi:threonine dehydrogenase-like Zn-dependent dehydrogenase